MGGALGWFVVALAGVAAAPPAERAKAQITYTVRMVDAQGIDWREGVFDRLKPVTRQGAATVWTLPREAAKQLVDEFLKCPDATMLQAPKVTASSGTPATIQCRRNRSVVTQAAWNGQDPATEPALENVRVGWHTTMIGRKLDQGVLVQVVFEDTAIRAVHHVTVNRPAGHRSASAAADRNQECTGAEKATGLMAIAHAIMGAEETCCAESRASCPADRSAGKDDDIKKVVLDIPEVDTQEILGEWLVPTGQALLVSFGAHTVADKDGMAVVKERLAIIEADEASKAIALVKPKAMSPAPAQLFTPHASEFAVPPPVIGTPAQGNVSIVPLLPPPALTAPAPAIRMAAPPAPSRSIPQGVHADGTPSELPPLPPDEADADSSSSESAEPRPSPQSKKVPPPKPSAKPTTDSSTSKVDFTLPKAAAMFVPSLFMPTSPAGFQFLLPIKPLSLKLPFGQRLEFEVVGRLVPEANGQEAAGSERTVARSR